MSELPMVPKSLNAILTRMNEMEEEIIEFKPDDHAALFEAAKEKIDNYKEYVDELESRIERGKAYAQEVLRRVEILENQKESLKKSLTGSMLAHNMPTIRGNVWEVNLRRRRKIEIPVGPTVHDFLQRPELVDVVYGWASKQPTPEIANKLQAAGFDAGIIDTTYQWNKKKVEEALEKDPEGMKDIASKGETIYIQFGTNKKGIK